MRKDFDGTKQFHIESIYNPNTYSIEAKGFDAFFIQNHFHYVEKLKQNHQFWPNLATLRKFFSTIEMISNEKCIKSLYFNTICMGIIC